MKGATVCSLVVALACVAIAKDVGAPDWKSLGRILDDAISRRVFPGATAAVFTRDEILYRAAHGAQTYGIPPPASPSFVPPITLDTMYDLASCTKVIAGTSAAAVLYQWGDLDLNAKVSQYLPGFEQSGKEDITVLNLLLHNAGLPADPYPNYNTIKFGCPETSKYHPEQTYSCREMCYDSLLKQTLKNTPGAEYVYSDISLMTIMDIIGQIAKDKKHVSPQDLLAGCPVDTRGWQQCYYEAFVRKFVFKPLKMSSSMFNPPTALWSKCAPTQNETVYRHRIIQGQVHDPNTYAMGGISGHAGLFSTVDDVTAATRAWLFAPARSSTFLNSTTTAFWTRQYNHSLSSRAIGWNTNSPDADDQGWNFCCGTLSAKTFMHIGYTGPMVCADPERGVGLVLLANRVYPDTSTSSQMHDVRNAFATAVQKLFDQKAH